MWVAVGLVGLAAAAHQGWTANIFTMASDMFPRRAVGSVVGIGGMAGSIGGMLIADRFDPDPHGSFTVFSSSRERLSGLARGDSLARAAAGTGDVESATS